MSNDAPMLRMTINKGKLVPASQFDEERLDSYRGFSEVWVQIEPTQSFHAFIRRKWWAVINKVVETCNVPWKNAEQASRALKLACGHSNQFLDEDKKWRAEAKSLNDFKARADFDEFFELAMLVLQERFGVDPEMLQRESPDIGPTEAKEENPVVDTGKDETPADGPEIEQDTSNSPDVNDGSGNTDPLCNAAPVDIALHMMRYVKSLEKYGGTDDVEASLSTFDLLAKGYAEPVSKMSKDEKQTVKTIGTMTRNAIARKEGFESFSDYKFKVSGALGMKVADLDKQLESN